MDMWQQYPTPTALAQVAVSKFKNREFTAVLEPSAYEGDLLWPILEDRYNRAKVYALEIDVTRHPILRSKGVSVIGTDFMAYSGPMLFSHILMNPPFKDGVDHVLKGWEVLQSGELVAIINAQTIKNPHTKKRELLVRLIEDFGSVEFREDSFMDPDTKRKTKVEVAIVYLRKEQVAFTVSLDGLKKDTGPDIGEVNKMNPLALPKSSIALMVDTFNLAVEYGIRSLKARAEARYYSRLLGKVPADEDMEAKEVTLDSLVGAVNDLYTDYKEVAWKRLIDSSEFTSKFSSKIASKIHGMLDELKTLEFTEENIHALLTGMMENKTEMDMEMVEDLFDEFTKYHPENRYYYKGWVSNEKHRIGMKVKHTRIIIPSMVSAYGGINYSNEYILRDIERVFALLDGKPSPFSASQAANEDEFSANEALAAPARFPLLDMVSKAISSMDGFRPGQRYESEYFEFRVYTGAGTLHLFPKRKDLIDRLNLVVGKRRKWLPDNLAEASSDFMDLYENPEEVSKEVDALWDKTESQYAFMSGNHKALPELYAEAVANKGKVLPRGRIALNIKQANA